MSSSTSSSYRADIDSLRAIAVMLVVLYHADISFFSGGFIGVDVFFVISGFLITGIVTRNISKGSFSIIGFYENRVRRILPALFVLCAAVLVLGCMLIFSGSEYGFLKRNVQTSLLAFSNIYLYFKTGYFDLPSVHNPLLHTWSLGVEEQFYLFYPAFLLLVCKKFYSKRMTLLFALFLFSFVLASACVFIDKKFAFFMLPTRAWELLAGGLLLLNGWTPYAQSHKKICIIAGLILILFPALFFTSNIPFPGLSAAVPCLGAVLFIAGGAGLEWNKSCLKFLCNKNLIFIGLISYSLYLWHWPLFVYYKKAFFVNTLSALEVLGLICLSVFLATLSWKFVETPVRRGGVFRSRRFLYPAIAGPFILLFIVSQIASPYKFLATNNYAAGAEDVNTFNNFSTLGVEGDNINFVVLGDSHAAMLASLFDKLAKEENITGKLISTPSPLKNTCRINYIPEPVDHKELYAQISKYHPQTIFISLRWIFLLEGHMLTEDPAQPSSGRHIVYENGEVEFVGKQAVYMGLKDTVDELLDMGVSNIYLFLPVPDQHYQVPHVAAWYSLLFPCEDIDDAINLKLAVEPEEYHERADEVISILKDIDAEYTETEVVLLDPTPYLFDGRINRFKIVDAGHAMFSDNNHLTNFGAAQLAPLVAPVLKSMAEMK